MQKIKRKDSRSIRSCKERRKGQSQPQKIKQHKSSDRNIKSKDKRLSLSFYNQETLQGSKKIMLDLLPIQSVKTQYFKVSENQQASGRVNVQSRAYHSKLNLNLKLFKKDSHQKAHPKGQNSKVQSARSTPQKNQTSGLKKSKQKQPKISKSQEKDRALQIKADNKNVERQKAYLQKYFGKYFKKLNPHSAR